MSQTLNYLSEVTTKILSTIYETVHEISCNTATYLSSILYDDEDFITYLPRGYLLAGSEPSSDEINAVIEEAKKDIRNDAKERELKARYENLMKEYLIDEEEDFDTVDDDNDDDNGATRLLVAS